MPITTTTFHAALPGYVLEKSSVACPSVGIAGPRLLLATRSRKRAAPADSNARRLKHPRTVAQRVLRFDLTEFGG
jgi:hypothetical protein